VIPKAIQTDETYQLILGTLDDVIGGLSETVLSFQKQIMEGAVCWKTLSSREKKRPSVCPDGFHWNGEQFCLPAPNLLQSHSGAQGTLEDTITRKGQVDNSASGKVPKGALPAICVEDSDFSEKIGHWCYATCPVGMKSVGMKCKSECNGEFPADDNAMLCGHNPGVIAEAITNMVITVITGALNAGLLISGMAEKGVDVGSLSGTIDALVDMGKPFAYRTCPLTAR